MAGRRRSRTPANQPDAEAAMEIAARFLATRPRSRQEVRRRLQRAAVEPPVIDAVMERLAKLGYVDDHAFVRWWADQRDRHSPRGRRLVEAELRQRGVGRDAIETLRQGWDDPERSPEDAELPASDEDRAAAALQRHLRGRPLPTDPRALQRLGMFLVRRGFEPETVRGTLRRARQAGPAEPHRDEDLDER